MTVIVKSKFSLTVPTEVQPQARRRNDRHMKAQLKRDQRLKNQTLSMNVDYLPRALKILEDASAQVAKAFFKRATFLEQNIPGATGHDFSVTGGTANSRRRLSAAALTSSSSIAPRPR